MDQIDPILATLVTIAGIGTGSLLYLLFKILRGC